MDVTGFVPEYVGYLNLVIGTGECLVDKPCAHYSKCGCSKRFERFIFV